MDAPREPSSRSPKQLTVREVEKQTFLLYGKQCLTEGLLDEGVEAHASAGVKAPPELLVLCGEVCMTAGLYESALCAFRAAGAVQHIERLGDTAQEQQFLGIALSAFRDAGATAKLVSLGRLLLASGHLERGTEACKAAGSDLPPDALVACGDACLSQGDYAEAELAFRAAGAAQRIVALGDIFSARGLYVDAIRVYEAAGSSAKLLALGAHCIKVKHFAEARAAYRAAVRLGARA